MILFNQLKSALSRTSSKLSTGIENIFSKRKLDFDSLDKLEELLICSDTGIKVARQVIDCFKKKKFSRKITINEVKLEVALAITAIMENYNHEFHLNSGLNTILVCGVNGNGKTTFIGKLASFYTQKENKKVAIAACDTFRAGATEQIAQWAKKADAVLFTGKEKADPASIAYRAVNESYNTNIDVLFIDTAGRLHNQKNLMNELVKIVNVIQKVNKDDSSYRILLVIDATTGQNALLQAEEFCKAIPVSGLVITKLDGTAKAGVVIGIVDKYSLPIHFIGIGEKKQDLKIFSPLDFAKTLVDI